MDTHLSVLAAELTGFIAAEHHRLVRIPDTLASASPGEGRWAIKEILGHLIDSASNNHQRMVRLQYVERLDFPDYTENNEQWVTIQAYQRENWQNLIALWQYVNLHIAHLIKNADRKTLAHVWRDGNGAHVTLQSIMEGYIGHARMHMADIHALAEAGAVTDA